MIGDDTGKGEVMILGPFLRKAFRSYIDEKYMTIQPDCSVYFNFARRNVDDVKRVLKCDYKDGYEKCVVILDALQKMQSGE